MLSRFRKAGIPGFVDIKRLSGWYLVHVGDCRLSGGAIADQLVGSGIDSNFTRAMSKAISEYIERLAFAEGSALGNHLCLTRRSEGFAAYPRSGKGISTVRTLSMCESVERFAWPEFWHNRTIAYRIERASGNIVNNASNFDFLDIFFIFPMIEDSYFKLAICVGVLPKRGVVVGGGCATNVDSAKTKALHEMVRHRLAVENIRLGYYDPLSHYEARLNYLSTAGLNIFEDRLSTVGTSSVKLPAFALDGLLEGHRFETMYDVYRTRFVGQREFIDDVVEVGYI